MILPKGFFTQLATLLLAVAIVITYVVPAFETISAMQDNIAVYQTERAKVVQVTDRLTQKVTAMDSITLDERNRLLAYLPDNVDEVAVQRDLLYITGLSGAVFKSVGYEGASQQTVDPEVAMADPTASEIHTFALSAEGTYQQVKTLLSLLDSNQYPLDIVSAEIMPLEGGFLSLNLQLTTYEFLPFGTEDALSDELTTINF